MKIRAICVIRGLQNYELQNYELQNYELQNYEL